jgi:hypothetical protein
MLLSVLKTTELNFLNKKQFQKVKNKIQKKFLFLELQDYVFISRESFEFSFLTKDKEYSLVIPKGSVMNGRNVPKILHRFIKPYGTNKDSVYAVHDYLYSISYVEKNYKKDNFINKELADLILLEMLKIEAFKNKSILKYFKLTYTYLECSFVRLFGVFYYKGIDHEEQ